MIKASRCIAQFLEHLQKQKGYSAHTVGSYRRDLSQFLEHAGDAPINTLLKKEFLRSFIHELSSRDLKPKSISRKRAALQSLIKYTLKMGYIQSDPMKSIANIKLDKPLPTTLPEQETERLLTLPAQTPIRDKAIVELFYGTGIRLSELYLLNCSDINRQQKTVKVLGKGGKERIVPVPSYTIELIDTYLKEQGILPGDQGPLFRGRENRRLSRRQIQRVVEKLLSSVTEREKKSPHTLRHSFASQILDKGADIRVVKELLGHASLQSTQIYTHVTKEGLMKAYKNAHPRSGSED